MIICSYLLIQEISRYTEMNLVFGFFSKPFKRAKTLEAVAVGDRFEG